MKTECCTKKDHTKVDDLNRTIGQLESNIVNLNKGIDELKKLFKTIQDRVVSVEKQNSFVNGCVALLLTMGGFFGIALDHLSRWFFGK